MQDQWVTISMGRPRPPVPAAPPAPTPSYTMAQPIRPPEVHVYQDPSIPSTRPVNIASSPAPPSNATRSSHATVPLDHGSLTTGSAPSAPPRFYPPQVYHHPRIATSSSSHAAPFTAPTMQPPYSATANQQAQTYSPYQQPPSMQQYQSQLTQQYPPSSQYQGGQQASQGSNEGKRSRFFGKFKK